MQVIPAQGGIGRKVIQIAGVIHIVKAPHFAVIALVVQVVMDDRKALLEGSDIGFLGQQLVHFGEQQPAFAEEGDGLARKGVFIEFCCLLHSVLHQLGAKRFSGLGNMAVDDLIALAKNFAVLFIVVQGKVQQLELHSAHTEPFQTEETVVPPGDEHTPDFLNAPAYTQLAL